MRTCQKFFLSLNESHFSVYSFFFLCWCVGVAVAFFSSWFFFFFWSNEQECFLLHFFWHFDYLLAAKKVQQTAYEWIFLTAPVSQRDWENMKLNEIDKKFKSYFIISMAQRISTQLDKSHFEYLKRKLIFALAEWVSFTDAMQVFVTIFMVDWHAFRYILILIILLKDFDGCCIWISK